MHLLLDQKNLVNSERSNYLIDKITNRAFHNKPKGQSLFFQLPKRDCLNANIVDYLCSCKKSREIDTNDEIIQHGAFYLVDYINNYLLKSYKKICMILKLKRVIDAQIILEKVNKYSIIFETYPNNAKFDAQFKVENIRKNQLPKLRLIGKIIRINSYGMSSRCIDNYGLRNFCYCFSYHTKIERNKTNIEISSKDTNTYAYKFFD